MKKIPEKFGKHEYKDDISTTIKNAVYDTQSPYEFEQAWCSMMEKYDLHSDEWVSGLFTERARWVPCFLKTGFWAGMSTTQRSESINAFFDGYLTWKTTLELFVGQYERALKSKVEKEFQAEFNSSEKTVPCVTSLALERQFQQVDTINKFKEFQRELTGVMNCLNVSTKEGFGGITCDVEQEVHFDGGCQKITTYHVTYNREINEFECTCHLFEFKGIICKLAIVVLRQNRVQCVPEKDILHRWRKDVKQSHSWVVIGVDGWVRTPEQERYDKLCKKFAKLADYFAYDEEECNDLEVWMDIQTEHFRPCNGGKSQHQGNAHRTLQCASASTADVESYVPILDPKHVR